MIQMNCQGLALGYDSALVRDLRFTVGAGDYLCILGENGAGKSTLMKTILGLLTPLEGSVTLSGGVRPNEIGYLPQQTQAQRDFPATVWEVALSGCQSRCGLRPFYTKAEKELARQSLRRMDKVSRCRCPSTRPPVPGAGPFAVLSFRAWRNLWGFAGVAGIMVFISFDELLPAAREYGEHHLSIYGLIFGMVVMAISLLLFL